MNNQNQTSSDQYSVIGGRRSVNSNPYFAFTRIQHPVFGNRWSVKSNPYFAFTRIQHQESIIQNNHDKKLHNNRLA